MEINVPYEGEMRLPESKDRLKLPDTAELIGAELGFVETHEMADLRARMVGLKVEDQHFSELYADYQDAGEAQADLGIGPEGRIALMLYNAQIKQSIAEAEAAYQDYLDAAMMADNYNMQKTVMEIETLIKRLELLSATWPADVPRH